MHVKIFNVYLKRDHRAHKKSSLCSKKKVDMYSFKGKRKYKKIEKNENVMESFQNWPKLIEGSTNMSIQASKKRKISS